MVTEDAPREMFFLPGYMVEYGLVVWMAEPVEFVCYLDYFFRGIRWEKSHYGCFHQKGLFIFDI